jgi:hypothetical protein
VRVPKKPKPLDTGLFSGAEAEKLKLEAFRVKNAKNRSKAAEMRRKAFGDVEKSFIPGKGWVKAVEAGKPALRQAQWDRPMYKVHAKTEARAEARKYQEHDNAVRAHIKEMKAGSKKTETRGKAERVTPGFAHDIGMKSSGIKAYAVHAGGRKGQRMIVAPKGTSKPTMKHEMAHITPKRSGYRLYKILDDPKKAMREEARADMMSGHTGDYHKAKGLLSRQTGSGYTASARSEARRTVIENQQRATGKAPMFSKEGVGAYRETQDKIAGARGYTPKGAPAKGTKAAENTKNRYLKQQVAIGGGTVATGATYGTYKLHQRKKAV